MKTVNKEEFNLLKHAVSLLELSWNSVRVTMHQVSREFAEQYWKPQYQLAWHDTYVMKLANSELIFFVSTK